MTEDSTITEFDALSAELQRRLNNNDVAAFQEFLKRNPQFVEDLYHFLLSRRHIADDDDFDDLMFFDDVRGHEEVTGLLPPTKTYDSSDADRAAECISTGRRFGDYYLLEKIAQGGMGIVYKASQASLGRLVAIKMIRPGLMTMATGLQRFRREAQACADLNHPNIVSIYDYGVFEGRHYFAMEYVDGPSLAELVRGGPMNAEIAAEYMRTIARTIDYAHNRGIIHRDLKPSNILIAPGNQPRITDFGVAKSDSDDDSLSSAGQMVGTPSYMSPEQSFGTIDAATPRADIYSLGAVLYAILTSRPPFLAATEVDTLIQVRTQEPVSPRSLNPTIPPDLEIICLKCLCKDPRQRYATAGALADDLGCYLQRRPILARPAGRAERLLRAARRNPAIALLATLCTLVAIIFVVSLTYTNSQLQHSNRKLNASIRELDRSTLATNAALRESEYNEARAAQLLYVSDMKEAGRAWRDGDARMLTERLEGQRPLPGKHDFRGGEWDFMWNHARTSFETLLEVDEPLYCVCYSPDGRRIATAGKDTIIRVLDLETRDLVLAITTQQLEVNQLAFSPDSNRLASAGDDGTVRLWAIDWEARSAREERTIRAHQNQAYSVSFALNGKSLVSSGRDPVVRLWDVDSGLSQGVLEGHTSTLAGICVSADGRKLASASHDGTIVLWDLSSRTQLKSFKSNSGRLTSVAISRDGAYLVATSVGRKVQVWSVVTGQLYRDFEHLDAVEQSVFTPDGTAIVACDRGGTLRIWKLANDDNTPRWSPGIPNLPAWKAHRDRIFAVAVSPDGQRLLSSSADGKLLAWDLAQKPQHSEVQKKNGDIIEMEFVPEQNLLATVGTHTIELWEPATGRLVKQLSQTDEALRCLTVSANGTTLATGSSTGQVDIWNVSSGQRKTRLKMRQNFQVDQLALSPDAATVAVIERYESDGDDLFVMDVASGRRLAAIVARSCNSAEFSPDGRWLVASGPANVITVWDLKSQNKVAEHSGHGSSINRIRFSADGQWVATASDDRLIKVWETAGWNVRFTLAGHRNAVTSIAFTPDGKTLASAGAEGRLKFWNVITGQELFELEVAPLYLKHLAFSPDGRFLASLYSDPSSAAPHDMLDVLKWRP